MKTLLPLLVLLALAPIASAQTVSIEWDLVIGDDESASEAYLLGGPTSVFDDSRGNIYVVEAKPKEIRVYDSTGKHLYTVGSGGNAPGDYQDVSAATVDQNDRLVVIDRILQRVTIYEPFSDTYRTLPFDPSRRLETSVLLSVNGQFVTAGVPRVAGASIGAAKLISFYDSTFEAVIDGTASIDTIHNLDDPFEVGIFGGHDRHSLWVDRSGSFIMLAPRIYSGKAHTYRKEQDGGWTHESIPASAPERNGYKQVDMSAEDFLAYLRSDDPANKTKTPMVARSTQKGRFIYESLRSSLALYALSDGSIVHFSHEWNRRSKTKDLRYELFSSEGEFLATGLMDGVLHYNPGGRPARLLFFESGGQKANTFYAVDYQSGFPVVRRGTITVN